MTEEAELTSGDSVSDDINCKFDPKVRWAIPHCLDFMTFVGKEVLAVVYDIFIIFLNLKSKTETVYVANSEDSGDGVDVISGHRSYLCAFAEKTKHARIFILRYPTMVVMAQLKDMDVNRYKGLCMMECDLVAGFTGFPNYLCTIWSWRTNQRLVCVETGVIRRKEIYVASRMHMTVCQCWGEGLIMWEVGQAHQKTFLLRRAKKEVTGWEISDPPLIDVCYANDGTLYAIDPKGILYSVASDGIAMVAQVEKHESQTVVGSMRPCMCAFGNGLLIYGPNKYIRALKKDEEKKTWKEVWWFKPDETVNRLVGNATCDVAAAWTSHGLVYSITGESEDKIEMQLVTYKMRDITRIRLIAPDFKYLAAMNEDGALAIYEVLSARLVLMKHVQGSNVSFEASPVDPLLAIYGETSGNYGVALYKFDPEDGLEMVGKMCLTHQIVSRVVFSPRGREFVAAAMSAGHIFIIKMDEEYKMTLVRYAELGRGLADCLLMKVGDSMRCFSLVLFSDKYSIGERVICINAETGKDNKFAGKMMGPYSRLLPCAMKDTLIAIPHLTRQLHVLKLSGEKGVTVSVKMGPIIETGHEIKQYDAFFNKNVFMTFSNGGHVILRQPEVPEEYDLKYCLTHRYASKNRGGFRNVVIDDDLNYIVHLTGNQNVVCTYLNKTNNTDQPVAHTPPSMELFDMSEENYIQIINENDKNYLDLQEEKKIREETMDYRSQRDEVVKTFEMLKRKLVELLEENIAEVPLHQLPLSEFNLHLEAKKERLKAAEKERERIRVTTEARIRAQDKVTAWIKERCWDSMKVQRVKLFAIFSHYHVENFAILPSQRDVWKELSQIEYYRMLQDEGPEILRPWEEPPEIGESTTSAVVAQEASQQELSSQHSAVLSEPEQCAGRGPRAPAPDSAPRGLALSGTVAHLFIPVPPHAIVQTLAYSFLDMHWTQHVSKSITQNLRYWFNKQFDEMMALKVREVGLVKERNARLRFIVEELNKLSDLRGSFHHLFVEIKDPPWIQEEQVEKLIKVEPEECSIEPYISPSQIVIVPPDPGPKDDFKERALMDMMDGVLEKLWHEEIKKPIPMPLCMLEKDPEHFNEDDLRLVFDYEAKVAFRNEERDKYRKMLHAEYAKLSGTLNEGILKFNQKVKDTWLLKVRIDSVIGQENLNLFRLRRTNLDRVEMAEAMEKYRDDIAKLEKELLVLNEELQQIQDQNVECQAGFDALMVKDRTLDKTFKSHFADLSPIIVEQCYKIYKKRPKWHQRASMIPSVLNELAQAILLGVKPPHLHQDCVDFYKAMEQLDLISNMPAVMDEQLWALTCRLRRVKVDCEIRARAVAQEMTYGEHAAHVWARAVHARRSALAHLHAAIAEHRLSAEREARNKTIQVVLPAGQVEITTTGHMEDFDDATLIPREEIEKINNVILKVGQMKLDLMKKQIEFRKGILSTEWEHAQMKMKLRHMEQELYSYMRLKIPKELQRYLKNKEKGYTDEMDYLRLEKEMESKKNAINQSLAEIIHRVEDMEVKIAEVEAQTEKVDKMILSLNVKVSEKRIHEDPLEPIRIRRLFKNRMETLVARSTLIREVQANHSVIVLLQTELELLRLKTYPTLASFRELQS